MMLRRIKIYRKWRGGAWVKTRHRGWITGYEWSFYIAYGFDPEMITYETYDAKDNH